MKRESKMNPLAETALALVLGFGIAAVFVVNTIDNKIFGPRRTRRLYNQATARAGKQPKPTS